MAITVPGSRLTFATAADMHRYALPGVCVASDTELPTFSAFEGELQGELPKIALRSAAALPLPEKRLLTLQHQEIDVAVLEDGWQFSLSRAPECAVRLSQDRRELTIPHAAELKAHLTMLPLIRTALECASAPLGVVSLHSACVEMDGEAVCFTASSGVGKSTRAMQWACALGAQLISGDRPSIRLSGDDAYACGVPWDGKERIYRNAQRPLKMICEIVRCDQVSAHRLTRREAQRLLMRQCFIPMWDTEAAAAVMAAIRRIIDRVPVVQLHCGMDVDAAREAYDLIYRHPERIA